MPEFNLLRDYPKVKRKSIGRKITEEARAKAAKLDFDYFDGKREYGFGGYVYDGRWQIVAKLAKQRYNLNENSRVLVDRSDKGFLVFDLKELIPGIQVYGTHPAVYPINHAMDGYGKWALINQPDRQENKNLDKKLIEERARQKMMPFLIQAESYNLPFKDNFFNTVISINNVCAYPEEKARKAVREIIRVAKNNGKNCYIQNDSWRNDEEKIRLMNWTLLCKTFLDVGGWAKLFQEEGYNGDWGFTIIC